MEGAKPGYGTSSIDDRRDCGDAARRRAAPVGNSHRSAHRLVDLRASGGRRGVPALLGRRGRAARYPTLAGAHDFGADRGAARICRRHVPGLACGRRSGNLWAIGAGKYDRRKPPADWRRLADSRRALLAQSAAARAKGLWHYTGRRPKHRNSIPWHRYDLFLLDSDQRHAQPDRRRGVGHDLWLLCLASRQRRAYRARSDRPGAYDRQARRWATAPDYDRVLCDCRIRDLYGRRDVRRITDSGWSRAWAGSAHAGAVARPAGVRGARVPDHQPVRLATAWRCQPGCAGLIQGQSVDLAGRHCATGIQPGLIYDRQAGADSAAARPDPARRSAADIGSVGLCGGNADRAPFVDPRSGIAGGAVLRAVDYSPDAPGGDNYLSGVERVLRLPQPLADRRGRAQPRSPARRVINARPVREFEKETARLNSTHHALSIRQWQVAKSAAICVH